MPEVSVGDFQGLFVESEDFARLGAAFDVFCPFEAIGMVHQEIRHASFLHYIFDPSRPHGFGSLCLEAFLRAATRQASRGDGQQVGSLTPLHIHLMDLSQVEVRREWKRIDLLLVAPSSKLVVATELKIDSGEHSGQLSRYRAEVLQEWPEDAGWQHLFVYLTKNAEDPSEGAASGWSSLPLAELADELHDISLRQPDQSQSQSLLSAYVAMLRRHHLANDELDALANKLWIKHRSALDYLMERRPDAASELMSELRRNHATLAQGFSEATGFAVVADAARPGQLHFAVADWDRFEVFANTSQWTASGRPLLVELTRGGHGGDEPPLHIRLTLGPADPAIRTAIQNALIAGGVRVKETLSPVWSRLVTERLLTVATDETFDLDATYNSIRQKATKFLATQLPLFDAAFAAHLAPTNQSAS